MNKTILTDSERFRWLERVTDAHGSVHIFGGLAGHYEVDVISNNHEGDILASGSGVTIEAAIDICAEALEEKLG